MADTVIGEVSLHAKGRLVFSVGSWKDKDLADIRKFLSTGRYDGPTKSGLAMSREVLPQVIEALIRLQTEISGVGEEKQELERKPPTMSRLMHGVGIRAMGKLMDKMMSAFNPANNNSQELIERQLRLIKDQCHWTEGRWKDLGGVEWNELQNVPRHIRILSNYLIRAHLQARTIAP